MVFNPFLHYNPASRMNYIMQSSYLLSTVAGSADSDSIHFTGKEVKR